MPDPIIIEIIGFIATFASVMTLMPQIIRTIKLKKARHISSFMCVLGIISSILWCTYASLIGATALLLSQAITLLTKIWLFTLKLKYTRRKNETWWNRLFR